MKLVNKISVLLLTTVMVFSFAGCGSSVSSSVVSSAASSTASYAASATASSTGSGKVDAIKKAGVLVVGTSADYAPYEFHTIVDGEDKIVGFDIAFAQYIADSLGVKLEIKDMSFDSLLISLAKGDFDLVMAGLTPTEKRKETVDFTDVFIENPQIVIIRKTDSDKYTNVASLNGATGGYQKGTVQEDIANKCVGSGNSVGLTKFYDLITELKTSKLDCVFTNKLTASAYVAANTDLMIQDVGIVYESTGFAGAIQKGNDDFVEYCNKCIQEMKGKGLIDQYVNEAAKLAGIDETV